MWQYYNNVLLVNVLPCMLCFTFSGVQGEVSVYAAVRMVCVAAIVIVRPALSLACHTLGMTVAVILTTAITPSSLM